MYNLMRTLIALLATAVLVFAGNVYAADRLGTVDLEKVFREYHKSRTTEEFINQRADAVRSYMVQMKEQLDKLRSEARRAGTDAANPGLSDTERANTRRNAAEAARKVKAKEAEIELYSAEAARDIRELENKKRIEIMADINAEIKRRAAVRGFNFILDSSGKTLNGQPALLLFPPDSDITGEVIRELNRTAVKNKTEKQK